MREKEAVTQRGLSYLALQTVNLLRDPGLLADVHSVEVIKMANHFKVIVRNGAQQFNFSLEVCHIARSKAIQNAMQDTVQCSRGLCRCFIGGASTCRMIIRRTRSGGLACCFKYDLACFLSSNEWSVTLYQDLL